MKVLLLGGGSSSEREISLRSADNVRQALEQGGHNILSRDPAEDGFNLRAACEGIDVVFPILHGEGGEDGMLQAELEEIGVPFLGSGSGAATLTFDKVRYKELISEYDILTPAFEVVTQETFLASPLVRRPYVLKPINGGSSIDTFIVRDPAVHPPKIQDALFRHKQMLLEELIEGDEITISVLSDQALPVIMIRPPEGKEFDYENKYNGQSDEIVSPQQISGDIQQHAQQLALKAHTVTGCRHLSRTDIIITEDSRLYVLETNTIPGMTKQSLYPKAAAAAGYDFPRLIERFIGLAMGKD